MISPVLFQTIYLSVIIFIFGTVIGSFLNVLIYRLPIGLDFKKGNSFCPKCEHELKWYDLFPLFSYIFLRGKCRYCKARISPQYPIVEALNGIMYVLAFVFLCKADYKMFPEFFGYCIILSCLIVLSWTDSIHNIIPDSMWIGVLIGGIDLYICQIVRAGGFVWADLFERLIGLVLVSGVLFILGTIFERLKGIDAIGGGDIKLMAAAGFALGWSKVVFATLVGTVIGLIITIIYITVSYKKEQRAKGLDPKEERAKAKEEKAKLREEEKKANENKIAKKVKAQRELEKLEEVDEEEEDQEDEERVGGQVPFGPHLAFGIAFALFFGDKILTWYVDNFANLP